MKLTYEDSRWTVCKKAKSTNLLIDLKAEDYGVICMECAITIYKAVNLMVLKTGRYCPKRVDRQQEKK